MLKRNFNFKMIIKLLLCLVLFFATFLNAQLLNKPNRDKNDKPYRLVCYVETSRANYRKYRTFKIEDIDTSKCTHVVYGFAKLEPADNWTIAMSDPWLDSNLKGYQRFNDLRKKNKHLTTLLSIGGRDEFEKTPNNDPAKYSQMAKNPFYRGKFVKSVVKMLKDYDFDGLDMDWEYPGEADRASFVALMTDLKQAFELHGFLLTAAVAADEKTINEGYDIPKLMEVVDFISVMAYDYHPGKQKLGLNAPLSKVDDSIKFWLKEKAEGNKTVLGLPFNGHTYKLKANIPKKPELGDDADGPGRAFEVTNKTGLIGWIEVCEYKNDTGHSWTRQWIDGAEVPIMYNNEVWISYDDHQSLKEKVELVKSWGLSGAMVWSLEMDDFSNECKKQKRNLLSSVQKYLSEDEDKKTTIIFNTTTQSLETTEKITTRPFPKTSLKPTTVIDNNTTTENWRTAFPPKRGGDCLLQADFFIAFCFLVLQIFNFA